MDCLIDKTNFGLVEGLSRANSLLTTVKVFFGVAGAEPPTISNGSVVMTAEIDAEGFAYFFPNKYGEWTVSITRYGVTQTQVVNVDAVKLYEAFLPPDLEALSWSSVMMIARAGKASAVWEIGDEKTFSMNGENLTAQIIGFNHDDVANPSQYGANKAGITFMMKNCAASLYPMNSSNTTAGGWNSSSMRVSTMATMLSQLSSKMRNAIVSVTKRSANGEYDPTIVTSTDSLFLLSEVELNNTHNYSAAGEGSQYEFFAAGNPIKKDKDYWLRSAFRNNGYDIVYTSGSLNYNGSPTAAKGVAFGFCV